MRYVPIAMVLFLFTCQATMAGPLRDAAKSGDAELVTQLLDEGAEVDEIHGVGTALHWAALHGHADIIKILAVRGAELGTKSDLLGTPLHTAANRGQTNAASALIQHGAEVDARDKDDKTPLHIAAKVGSNNIAEILINAGADVNAIVVGHGGNRYKLGEMTPLHLALQEDNLEIADALRAAGAVATPVEPASEILARANAETGRELAGTYCRTCHAIEAGDADPVTFDRGPNIVGILGQQVARDTSFKYSDALREFGGVWTDDRLYAYALRPMLTVPGTSMGHQLVRKPEEIADIIAYLKSLDQ